MLWTTSRTIVIRCERDDLPKLLDGILLPFEHAVVHKSGEVLDLRGGSGYGFQNSVSLRLRQRDTLGQRYK